MAATLQELATLVGGTLVGAGDVAIAGAAPLAEAKAEQITLVDKAERAGKLAGSLAAAVVAPLNCPPLDRPAILTADVHGAFQKIVRHFRPARVATRTGISPAAHVSPSAKLGRNVQIGPGATVGDDVVIGDDATLHAGVHIMAGCRIGQSVTIYPNTVLYEDTLVGDRCILHACVVLGANGFGYSLVGGKHTLGPQLGHVEIGDDVEIGAGSTIDRGSYGPTRVGSGTKIDDQVMVAHNCQIGRHNILCSQVGIAGSSTTGDYVVIAGQAGIRDHVHIGSRAVLGAMSGVMADVPEGCTYLGIPATPDREQMLKQAALAKLPELRKQVRSLEAAVERLEQQAGNRPSAAA